MLSPINTFLAACKLAFKNRNNQFFAILLSLLFFVTYVSVPVFLVPGNDYSFFFSTISVIELFFIAFISVLLGVLFSLQLYSWQQGRSSKKTAALGISGFFAGALSGIFSTATCIACVSALFSFLGFGGMLFLIQHRNEISLLSSIFVLSALFFSSKKITNECKSCKIR